MRNILFTTQKKNVTWVQRNLRFNNKNNHFGLTKQPNPLPPLSLPHPNIQDMLHLIHETFCHSKYATFSPMKMYAWIDWMQTDA